MKDNVVKIEENTLLDFKEKDFYSIWSEKYRIKIFR